MTHLQTSKAANRYCRLKSSRRYYFCFLSFCCTFFIVGIIPLLLNFALFNETCLAANNHLTKPVALFKTSLNNYNMPYFSLKPKKTGNDKTISLAAVGDIRITRRETVKNIRESLLKNEKNIIITMLRSKDIVAGNLEMAFTNKQNSCITDTGTGEPEWAMLLAELQFSILNLANNHFQFDAGICGIETSLEILNKEALGSVGMGNNFLAITKNDVKVGMLGYARYTMNNDKIPAKYLIGDLLAESILQDVKRYKALVDHLVIFVHWGEALMKMPNPKEEELAKELLAAGASVIIGTGPHVLQRIDIYENGVIAYSLGNYIFDEFIIHPQANVAARNSCILEIEFGKHSIESVNLVPVFNNNIIC